MNGGKWWVPYIEDYEYSLPESMRKDITEVINRNPDSDSDEGMIDSYIKKSMDLFTDEKFFKN